MTVNFSEALGTIKLNKLSLIMKKPTDVWPLTSNKEVAILQTDLWQVHDIMGLLGFTNSYHSLFNMLL